MNKIIVNELSKLVEKYIDYDKYKMKFEDLDEANIDELITSLHLPNDIQEFIWNSLSEEASGWNELRELLKILSNEKDDNEKFSEIYKLIE